MNQHVIAGNPPVEITLRPSAQARRISLRLSGLDGRVTLSYPRHVPLSEALAFAHAKADWLRRKLAATPEIIRVGYGSDIPVGGKMLRIQPGTGRITQEGDTLFVPAKATPPGVQSLAWLKALARDQLAEASDRYASALGRPYVRLSLRDTRSRWGSCTAAGGLMYSWRLILAPYEVLDYVAAHEVAHLREMHHGPEFWELVRDLCPGYEAPRRWLRDHGAGLHRYRFRD